MPEQFNLLFSPDTPKSSVTCRPVSFEQFVTDISVDYAKIFFLGLFLLNNQNKQGKPLYSILLESAQSAAKAFGEHSIYAKTAEKNLEKAVERALRPFLEEVATASTSDSSETLEKICQDLFSSLSKNFHSLNDTTRTRFKESFLADKTSSQLIRIHEIQLKLNLLNYISKTETPLKRLSEQEREKFCYIAAAFYCTGGEQIEPLRFSIALNNIPTLKSFARMIAKEEPKSFDPAWLTKKILGLEDNLSREYSALAAEMQNATPTPAGPR